MARNERSGWIAFRQDKELEPDFGFPPKGPILYHPENQIPSKTNLLSQGHELKGERELAPDGLEKGTHRFEPSALRIFA
jgi:hypothetical protein